MDDRKTNEQPRLTERFARAMARRNHERLLERLSLKGIPPAPYYAREQYLERAIDSDWFDYFDLAVAVTEELDRIFKAAKAKAAT